MFDSARARADLADRLRREARGLLEEGLREVIERRIGPVQVAGSVALDLMAVPDIDLYAHVEGADAETMLPLLAEIPAQLAAQGCALATITFRDEHVQPDPAFPTAPGLYLGTTFVAPNESTWKVDLWGWGAVDQARRLAEDRRLVDKLAAVDRDLVLRCKHLDGYGRDFTSVDVYAFAAERRAVAGGDLAAEFGDFRAAHRH